MKYTVTRQMQWPTGELVVEISEGGIDFCNPNALCSQYPGEFQEFDDPREAIETAITIALAWQADKPDAKIGIALGCTHGMTLPFEGEILEEDTFFRLRKQAIALATLFPEN